MKFIDKLIKKIFDAKQAPEVDPTLIRAYGEKLGEGIIKGYGKTLGEVDYDTPDYNTIAALQNNAWHFSAAKTHTQLRDMSKALIGPDGKIRDFKSFRIAAEQITGEHLKWLKTEYNTAIAGGQMAGKWVEIQAQKDLFPLLEFVAVMDDHTSDICRALHGVILPVDHPFWLIWYPPNHYNERATVKQLRSGKITPDDKIVYPEKIQAMFKVNLGVQGLAFPPGHPYYTDIPAHVINNATLYMPVNQQYIVKYKASDGTEVAVNRKTDIAKGEDLATLIKTGKTLADKGYTVDILPEIHVAETELRSTLLPGAKAGRNPDLLINDDYVEVKTPGEPVSRKKIVTRIAAAAKQADRAIIVLEEEYAEAELKKIADERFNALPELKEIGFVTIDGEYLEYLND